MANFTITLSKRKADAISNGVFLVGIGILIYLNSWWPSLLLVLWATLAMRQYLTGRFFDLAVSTIILVGLFVVSFFKLDWTVLVPVLFVLGGIYIIYREYSLAETIEPEDITRELENGKNDRNRKT